MLLDELRNEIEGTQPAEPDPKPYNFLLDDPALRARLEEAAEEDGRTLRGEIMFRLWRSFDHADS